MIRITGRLADGRTELVVDGHEGHVEDGRVCAAVSAIVSTALLGLAQVAAHHPDLITIDISEER